jgi:TP901 family phage tail tape measure protein
MGFYQVLNLAKRAINDMKTHIQELDTVMTKIAVVTNMSQDDLWNQIGKYSEIARQYGVAIKGVYEVSQIYYQQGLQKGDVMGLTTETLKMARIAGLDYATAADYMTTAIRGFKMEMSEANRVTDVFSNLAAHTASDTEELATAISKTASSAEAVGASFEATSAMIATMGSVTRESATNIGTALKSVISRYGEMTSDPSKLVDSEGEEMSLNRVDAALKTIGITLQDVNG